MLSPVVGLEVALTLREFTAADAIAVHVLQAIHIGSIGLHAVGQFPENPSYLGAGHGVALASAAPIVSCVF